MSEATSQLLDDARKALQWLLNNIRQDAPQLSGKAMGNAERVVTVIDAALSQPAPSPQPAVPVVSDERLLHEWDRVSHITEAGSRRLAFARAILALRPAVEPMTPEQRDYVSVPISLIRRAQSAINWHLEPNSPDEHEATMLELTAIGWPNVGPGITAKAEVGV